MHTRIPFCPFAWETLILCHLTCFDESEHFSLSEHLNFCIYFELFFFFSRMPKGKAGPSGNTVCFLSSLYFFVMSASVTQICFSMISYWGWLLLGWLRIIIINMNNTVKLYGKLNWCFYFLKSNNDVDCFLCSHRAVWHVKWNINFELFLSEVFVWRDRKEVNMHWRTCSCAW